MKKHIYFLVMLCIGATVNTIKPVNIKQATIGEGAEATVYSADWDAIKESLQNFINNFEQHVVQLNDNNEDSETKQEGDNHEHTKAAQVDNNHENIEAERATFLENVPGNIFTRKRNRNAVELMFDDADNIKSIIQRELPFGVPVQTLVRNLKNIIKGVVFFPFPANTAEEQKKLIIQSANKTIALIIKHTYLSFNALQLALNRFKSQFTLVIGTTIDDATLNNVPGGIFGLQKKSRVQALRTMVREADKTDQILKNLSAFNVQGISLDLASLFLTNLKSYINPIMEGFLIYKAFIATGITQRENVEHLSQDILLVKTELSKLWNASNALLEE